MIDLLQKHLVVLERRFESLFLALPFDRHAEDICRPLQESDVSFAEFPCRSTIDFEHTVRRSVALQDDVYGSPDTMCCKKIRRSESLLACQMIRDHRLACVQRKA